MTPARVVDGAIATRATTPAVLSGREGGGGRRVLVWGGGGGRRDERGGAGDANRHRRYGGRRRWMGASPAAGATATDAAMPLSPPTDDGDD